MSKISNLSATVLSTLQKNAFAQWPEGLMLLDTEGNIISFNLMAETLTGWSADLLQGINVHEIFCTNKHEQQHQQKTCPLIQIESRQDCILTDQFWLNKEGLFIKIDFRKSPVFEKNQLQCIVITFHDHKDTRYINRESRHLALFSENSPSPIAEIDAHCNLHYTNPAMLALLMKSGYNLDGRPVIFPDNILEIATQCLHQQQSLKHIENQFQNRWYNWNFHPFPEKNLIICYGADITIQKQTEIEIAHAKQTIEAASQSKSAFIANMSHELRSPINAIMGFCELMMLDTKHQRPDEYEKLEKMYHAGEYLMSLIGNILDISKIEAQQIELESIPYNLYNIIQSVVSILRVRAEDKRINLNLIFPPSFEALTLQGDPTFLKQIIINLVGNAIKFTHQGKVDINVKLSVTNQIAHLSIHIEDTGIGIPTEKQQLVFQKFSQADNSTTRKFGGTGLGLAISKELLELMGGHIELSSQPQQGSIFIIHLDQPVSLTSTPAQNQNNKQPINDLNFAGKRILLVDDELSNRMVAKGMLDKLTCDIDWAENGKQGLQKLIQNQYDLVFMDCQMPEMDGYDATRTYRLLERTRPHTTPIIAMTANAMKGDKEKCIEAGMDDYLAKPVTLNHIRLMLAKWLIKPE